MFHTMALISPVPVFMCHVLGYMHLGPAYMPYTFGFVLYI